jgi:hypothetical protein
MSITMMSSRATLEADPTNVRVVRDYLGHEAGLKHSKRCPHYTGRTDGTRGALLPECCTDYLDAGEWDWRHPCCVVEPLYMHTTHHGLVLGEGEYNGYDDSDFYAEVWNPDTRRVERITYATTRGWSYPNHCTVDATPETLAAVAAWREEILAARRESARKNAEERQRAADAVEAERLRVLALKGRRVTVGKGKRAFTGDLFWVGVSRSGDSVRIGVKNTAGAVKWCASTSV